jgi:hypothetical protein
MFRVRVLYRLWWRGSAELLFRSPAPWSQSDSLDAEGFGHVPEGFVEPDIFIDAFDGPALGHPAAVGPAARVVALTAADNILLDRVQGSPKILCSVSKASRIEEHRGADRGLVEILPAISCGARGQGQAFRISQDTILEELYLVHDIGYGAKDVKRGFNDRIPIESGMFNRDPLKCGVSDKCGAPHLFAYVELA